MFDFYIIFHLHIPVVINFEVSDIFVNTSHQYDFHHDLIKVLHIS